MVLRSFNGFFIFIVYTYTKATNVSGDCIHGFQEAAVFENILSIA